MGKLSKIVFGMATLIPLIYVLCFFLLLFFHLTNIVGGIPERNILVENFDVLFVAHLAAMVWILALTILYIVHIAKHPSVKSEMRVVWIVAVLMANVFAMPIYWYLHIWRDRTRDLASNNR